MCEYVHNFIKDGGMYYNIVNELQLVPKFEDALTSFLRIKKDDTFVTGSNLKFLSKDIITEFYSHDNNIYISPLSFSEFITAYNSSVEQG